MSPESPAEPPFDRRRYPAGFAFHDWIAADGWRHRAFRWAPAGATRGSLLFQTGRADYAEKYLEAYAHFVGTGWNVEGFDWRGQGGSGRMAASGIDDRASFEPLAADLLTFVDDWRQRTPGPHVLVAHSMGGYAALRALSNGLALDAVVLAAPMFALHTGILPHWLARAVARAMLILRRGGRGAWRDRRIEPARQLRLTADRARYDDARWWRETMPELGSGVPSWRWIAAALALPRGLAKAPIERIATPVLLLLAGRDVLVDRRAAERIAYRLPRATLVTIADARHEVLREADDCRIPAFAAIDAFLDEAVPR